MLHHQDRTNTTESVQLFTPRHRISDLVLKVVFWITKMFPQCKVWATPVILLSYLIILQSWGIASYLCTGVLESFKGISLQSMQTSLIFITLVTVME